MSTNRSKLQGYSRKKNDSTNEGELIKEDKFVEETKSDPDDNKEVEPPKKDFGVDSSVIKMNVKGVSRVYKPLIHLYWNF